MGRAGLISSAMGLGTLAFTGGYGPVTDLDCIRTIRHALDMGITMLDTAGYYLGGKVERLMGRALVGRRDEAIIATRGGVRVDQEGALIGLDGSPQSLQRSCDASLRALGVDHIDLYYLARVDPDVPLIDSIGTLSDLVAQGKIRYIGCADASSAQLREAHAVHPLSAISSEYSLASRRVEAECLDAARALGIGFIACRPLLRGYLTGQVSSLDTLSEGDLRRDDLRLRPGDAARDQRLHSLQQMAAELDLGSARLALAWLLAQPDDIVPIPSTRSIVHLEMNRAALDVRLDEAELERLRQIYPSSHHGTAEPGLL